MKLLENQYMQRELLLLNEANDLQQQEIIHSVEHAYSQNKQQVDHLRGVEKFITEKMQTMKNKIDIMVVNDSRQ